MIVKLEVNIAAKMHGEDLLLRLILNSKVFL
jgi:hypothetical protein